jgi:hypothetical protein
MTPTDGTRTGGIASPIAGLMEPILKRLSAGSVYRRCGSSTICIAQSSMEVEWCVFLCAELIASNMVRDLGVIDGPCRISACAVSWGEASSM